MQATKVVKPSHQVEPITVYVSDVTAGTTDAAIIEFAMEAARETRGRLFGWSHVRFDDGTATVRLERD
jgi:hypothetical protein